MDHISLDHSNSQHDSRVDDPKYSKLDPEVSVTLGQKMMKLNRLIIGTKKGVKRRGSIEIA